VSSLALWLSSVLLTSADVSASAVVSVSADLSALVEFSVSIVFSASASGPGGDDFSSEGVSGSERLKIVNKTTGCEPSESHARYERLIKSFSKPLKLQTVNL
jgi:hypothetical protein